MAKRHNRRFQPPPLKSKPQLLAELPIARDALRQALDELDEDGDSGRGPVLTSMLKLRTVLHGLIDHERKNQQFSLNGLARKPKKKKKKKKKKRKRKSGVLVVKTSQSVYTVGSGQTRVPGSRRSQA